MNTLNGISSIWFISNIELIWRMVLAVVLGGLVGMEREWHNHAAGFRTHILVCLGSATIMLLSIYGFSEFVAEANVRIDPARLAAQVISGIGFLGAGAILRNGSSVKGLTTAASIWVVAGIGLCIGAGFIYPAFVATLLVLISLLLLNKWEKYLLRHRRSNDVTIKAHDDPGMLGNIAYKFSEQGIQIINVKMTHDLDQMDDEDGRAKTQFYFNLQVKDRNKILLAVEQIKGLESILSVETSPGHDRVRVHQRLPM